MLVMSLEEINESIGALVNEAPTEQASELETEEALQQYALKVEGLNALGKQVQEKGASRDVAISLEALTETKLPERYPVNSFTQIPSKTNYTVALEAIGAGKVAAAAALITAIFAGIYKLVKWVISVLRGSKGVGATAAKEAAQARTANETANEATKSANSGELKVVNFDPNEITKLRNTVFIEPALAQISKAAFLLLLEQRKYTKDTYSKIYQLLCSENDLYSVVEKDIEAFTDRLRDFIRRSAKDQTTQEIDLVRWAPQPLLPFVYVFKDLGILEPELEFHGRSYSKVGKLMQNVTPVQYNQVMTEHLKMVTEPVNLMVPDDAESSALVKSCKLATAEAYAVPGTLEQLEASVKWFSENVRIPDNADLRLSRIEVAIKELEKVCVEFNACSATDLNAATIAPGLVPCVRAYQQAVLVLSRLTSSARVLQRQVAIWFRLMTTAETASLNYLASVTVDESATKLKDLVAKKRKEHARTLRRFEDYAK